MSNCPGDNVSNLLHSACTYADVVSLPTMAGCPRERRSRTACNCAKRARGASPPRSTRTRGAAPGSFTNATSLPDEWGRALATTKGGMKIPEFARIRFKPKNRSGGKACGPP